MGSVNAKDTNVHVDADTSNISIPPSLLERKSRQMKFMSPLHKSITAAMDDADPRSPSCKRTPVHTPLSTPPLNGKSYNNRVLTRLGSASKFACPDPRSPGSRTPVPDGASDERPTPPPFSLGLSYGGPYDPRSPTPYIMRTPLALTQEVEVVSPDVVVAEEIIMSASIETPVKMEKIDLDVVVVESSTVVESTAQKTIREVFSSPEYSISPAIMALTISPLSSPALGRKRKPDLVMKYNSSVSPLKKSFSAPADENTPPQLKLSAGLNNVNNSSNNNKIRTPLSPLSTRVMHSRFCTQDVQPIKFRMDPGILG